MYIYSSIPIVYYLYMYINVVPWVGCLKLEDESSSEKFSADMEFRRIGPRRKTMAMSHSVTALMMCRAQPPSPGRQSNRSSPQKFISFIF
jgi:hypothetical protein